MKHFVTLTLLFIVTAGFIVRRHDIPDEAYLKQAQQFEDYTCHLDLPDGNGTFISSSWILTGSTRGSGGGNKIKKRPATLY